MKKKIILGISTLSLLILAAPVFADTVPTITGVTASNPDGAYKAGSVIHVQVNFSENVSASGTPLLTLSTGAPAVTSAEYVSGSGSPTFAFDYTVAPGNTSSDLDYFSTTSLLLNSGTIKNATGTDANLTLPAPGSTGSLSANKMLVIDTTAPMLTQVTPVPNPTSDDTPEYTFSSSEAGTITYGGDCGSPASTAQAGNNTVTFNTLTNDLHNNCTIMVMDAAGNSSASLLVSAFSVTKPHPPLAPVVKKMVNINPSGQATLTGTLKALSSNLLTLSTWGGDWMVNLLPTTKLSRGSNGVASVSELAIGDSITVHGKANMTTPLAIDARTILDHSIERGEFRGIVSNLTGSTFTLTTKKYGVFQVTVRSDAKILVNGKSGTMADLANGATITVGGILNRTALTLLATKITTSVKVEKDDHDKAEDRLEKEWEQFKKKEDKGKQSLEKEQEKLDKKIENIDKRLEKEWEKFSKKQEKIVKDRKEVTLFLAPLNNSGEMGTATLEEEDGRVAVTLRLKGAPDNGAQPAHIHAGSCPTPGAVTYPLTSVSDGESKTFLTTTLDALASQFPLAINVHKSAAEANMYVACGDVRW